MPNVIAKHMQMDTLPDMKSVTMISSDAKTVYLLKNMLRVVVRMNTDVYQQNYKAVMLITTETGTALMEGVMTMHDMEKVIDKLNTDVLPFLQHHCDMQCDREKRWISKMIITVHDAIALLKEQKDMIPIQTVAEYLAQYTAPPVRSPLAVYGDLVKAWERFLDGLRKRENKND